MKTNANRYRWIDSIKGISILGVVMIHSGAMAIDGVIGNVARYGSTFVQAFFVVSAFLAWKSIEKTGDDLSFRDSCKWIGRKLIKLAPLFYIAILMYSILIGGNEYWAGDLKPISLSNIIAHLLFLHGLFPKYCNSILGVEWYIGVLAIFYFLAPFIHRFINSLPRAIVFFLIIDIGCYYLNSYAMTLLPNSEYSYIFSEFINGYCFIFQLPTLSLGILLYYLLKRDYKITTNKYVSVMLSVISILLAVCILKYYGIVAPYIPFFKLALPTLFALSFFVYMVGQDIYSLPLINNCVFDFLGRHSYGIYLFHVLLLYLYEKYVRFYSGISILDWFIEYSFAIIVSVMIDLLATRLLRRRD